MSAPSVDELAQLRRALQESAIKCSERCLYHTFKWTSELLNALPDHDNAPDESLHLYSSLPFQTDAVEQDLEHKEFNKFIQAKSFFDCREYQRCASVFLLGNVGEMDIPLSVGATQDHHSFSLFLHSGISQKSLFLALYALLMAGEKQKTEDLGQLLGPSDRGDVVNKQIIHIKQVLNTWFKGLDDDSNARTGDGFLEYMYGMILSREHLRGLAKTCLVKSVTRNPWNWGAWLELGHLIADLQELHELRPKLGQHVMVAFFYLCCRVKLNEMTASLLADLDQLQNIFPQSQLLQGQRAVTMCRKLGNYPPVLAMITYSNSDIDYEAAKSLFDQMTVSHPRSLDFIDEQSNLFFLMGARDRSAFLAQYCTAVDEYRPETCLAVRNYYSLVGRHEDAVSYFRKALALDRNYGSAWILLGHEYDHLENTHAATSCYHRAVQLDPYEYRGLFGLGECYEALKKPMHAIHYYRRAVRVNKTNMSLWAALADCQIEVNRFDAAIKTLESALEHIDPYVDGTEGSANLTSHLRYRRIEVLKSLAQLYRSDSDSDNALATETIQRCLNESSEHLKREDTEQAMKDNLKDSIIPQAEILLKKWTELPTPTRRDPRRRKRGPYLY
ncbi:hypothetical protein Hte_009283 [Hypoxylon texense]